jgi:hypothetical protein
MTRLGEWGPKEIQESEQENVSNDLISMIRWMHETLYLKNVYFAKYYIALVSQLTDLLFT